VTQTIAEYNARYADYIRRSVEAFGQDDITEQALLNAHTWAEGHEHDVRPPEGWARAYPRECTGRCHRCDGAGTMPFHHIYDGLCFECRGHKVCQRKCAELGIPVTADV
jgi:hypothetical protein